MEQSFIKEDGNGLYIVVEDWITRPVDSSEFKCGDRIKFWCVQNGEVKVRLASGVHTAEVWTKRLPYWWHIVEGDNAGAAELRATNLRDYPSAYGAMADAFSNGVVIG